MVHLFHDFMPCVFCLVTYIREVNKRREIDPFFNFCTDIELVSQVIFGRLLQ